MSDSIIEMYKAGHSLAEVGEAHGGISRERVRQILVANGENDRFFKQKKKDEWEQKMYGDAVAIIRERYIKGEYLRVVARDVGVPWYVVEKLYTKTEADEQAHERAKFFNKIKVGSIPEGFDTPCLEWTGTMNHGNTPIYCQNNARRNAKAWHWWFEHGEWVTVERICPNALCVALEHMQVAEEHPPKPVKVPKVEKYKDIIDARKSGKTLESVGADFNITGERVRQIVARYGKK